MTTQEYVNQKAGVSFRPPKHWRKDESGRKGSTVIFFEPHPDEFGANVNLVVRRSSGGLSEAVRASKQQSSQLFHNYTLHVDKDVTLRSGQRAHLLGGSFTQGKFDLRNFQLLFVKKRKLYVVTTTARQGHWPRYRDTFRTTLGSVTLT